MFFGQVPTEKYANLKYSFTAFWLNLNRGCANTKHFLTSWLHFKCETCRFKHPFFVKTNKLRVYRYIYRYFSRYDYREYMKWIYKNL